jgi:Na+/melibiose symporter-like transporter
MGIEQPSGLPAPAKLNARLPRNVWALAWVAFFNDTSTEMGYWLLPQFLATVLGAPPMAFGLIEGAAETIASFSRLLSGWLSDLTGRRKPLTAAGYTLANIVKPLLAVTHSWPEVFWIRFGDRAAKGFRSAPRDALIADSLDPPHRGAGFGLRQAMDTAGAIVGPLSAVFFLRLFAGKIRAVFWMAALPGLVSILLVWFGVKEVRRAAPSTTLSSPTAHSHRFVRGKLLLILCAVGLFSLGNSSDLFLILRPKTSA